MYPAKARLEIHNNTEEEALWSCSRREPTRGRKFISQTNFTISLASNAENWFSRDIRVQIGRSLKS